MLKIKFWYSDAYGCGEQECICESLEQCKEFYGLDECEHRILSIEEV